MKKLLALNRSEIAIRIMRAATELGLRTVAIYSKEDRLSLHRFKADEAYQIGEGKGPVQAYLDVEGILALAKEKGVDAIHPGYGFLSENPALRACERASIAFVGPSAALLRLLGDKTAARRRRKPASRWFRGQRTGFRLRERRQAGGEDRIPADRQSSLRRRWARHACGREASRFRRAD
jgi:pyruvate carboxylase